MTARSAEVEIEVPFDGRWEHDPQRTLAGAKVELLLDGGVGPLQGRVAAAPPET